MASRRQWTRRRFLEQVPHLTMTAGAVWTLPGCGGSGSDAKPAGPDAGVPSSDAGAEDAAIGPTLQGGSPDPLVEAPTEAVELSKRPYTQVVGLVAVRLRFETLQDVAIPVRIQQAGAPRHFEPGRTSADVQFSRPAFTDDVLPDEPGLHVMHEVVLEGLAPGERYEWIVETGGGTEHRGSFLAPPGPGTAFTLAWLADTMWPNTDPTVARLVEEAPDLIVHGGDLEYQSNPFDTWSGLSRSMQPLTDAAPWHALFGNHESDQEIEPTQMYDRLFSGQGEARQDRYFAFSYGSVRFLCLDSETDELETPGSPQLSWVKRELEAVDANPDLAFAIVTLHRPLFTLGKGGNRGTARRDNLHPMFVEHRVPLVLGGDVHAYEHFLVDGVHYVVDGGAGALLYDPDETYDEVAAARPGEPDLRVAVSQSYGATVVRVEADGTIRVTRVDAGTEGAVADSFDVSP